MINLPSQEKQWKQSNSSDLYGNISVTKNINFDNEGYLALSNSPRLAMDNSIDSDFDNPSAIIFSPNHGYFVPTWDNAFQVDERVLSSYPTQVTDTGIPSTDIESDVVWFGGLMPLSQDTDLDYYTPGTDTWTDTNISLTGSGQHPIENFLSLSALAVANVNTVKLYANPLTATPTLITTLNILADFEITGMKYLNQNLYIATRNIYGGHAFLYVWNGSGSAAQQAYEVDSNIIFSLTVHKGSIVLLTGQGELLQFTGGGFKHLDAFPIFYTDRALTDTNNIGNYKNIMKSNGDVLYILFNDSSNSIRLTNQPDGVWCYDEDVGLYHKYSLSNSLVNVQTIATSAVNTTTDQITVSSPALPTGTEVYYRDAGGTVLAGLTNETKYFVINVDSTHIKLATTKALALAGTAIDLTGTGNNSQTLVFFPNIDFGAFLTDRTMSLCVIDRPSADPQYGTDIIWGAEVNRRTLSGDNAALGTTTGYVEARGYFITPKIFSNEVTDMFNLLTLKYSRFTSELDKIIIKYRVTDDMRHEIDTSNSAWRATWTSTTTFTTTQADFADAVVGDEVEFLDGAAGGMLAHITAISENAGTYTVTIDETFDQYITGDVSTVIFRNWTKFATIDSTNATDQGFFTQNIDMAGKFIQLKVELRGLGVKVEELKVDNKFFLPSTI